MNYTRKIGSIFGGDKPPPKRIMGGGFQCMRYTRNYGEDSAKAILKQMHEQNGDDLIPYF